MIQLSNRKIYHFFFIVFTIFTFHLETLVRSFERHVGRDDDIFWGKELWLLTHSLVKRASFSCFCNRLHLLSQRHLELVNTLSKTFPVPASFSDYCIRCDRWLFFIQRSSSVLQKLSLAIRVVCRQTLLDSINIVLETFSFISIQDIKSGCFTVNLPSCLKSSIQLSLLTTHRRSINCFITQLMVVPWSHIFQMFSISSFPFWSMILSLSLAPRIYLFVASCLADKCSCYCICSSVTSSFSRNLARLLRPRK